MSWVPMRVGDGFTLAGITDLGAYRARREGACRWRPRGLPLVIRR